MMAEIDQRSLEKGRAAQIHAWQSQYNPDREQYKAATEKIAIDMYIAANQAFPLHPYCIQYEVMVRATAAGISFRQLSEAAQKLSAETSNPAATELTMHLLARTNEVYWGNIMAIRAEAANLNECDLTEVTVEAVDGRDLRNVFPSNKTESAHRVARLVSGFINHTHTRANSDYLHRLYFRYKPKSQIHTEINIYDKDQLRITDQLLEIPSIRNDYLAYIWPKRHELWKAHRGLVAAARIGLLTPGRTGANGTGVDLKVFVSGVDKTQQLIKYYEEEPFDEPSLARAIYSD